MSEADSEEEYNTTFSICGCTSWKPIKGKRIESVMYLNNTLVINLEETTNKIYINGSVQCNKGYLEFNVSSLGKIQGFVLIDIICDRVKDSITIVTEIGKVEILVHMKSGSRESVANCCEGVFSDIDDHICICNE